MEPAASPLPGESLRRARVIHRDLAAQAHAAGRDGAALQHYEKALALAEAAHGMDSEEVWDAHRALGRLYVAWGDPPSALPHFHAALAAARSRAAVQPRLANPNDPTVLTIALRDLGGCHAAIGDGVGEAHAGPLTHLRAQAYRDGMAYHEEAAGTVAEAGAYGSVVAKGGLEAKLGRYADAIETYEYALHVCEKFKLGLSAAPPADVVTRWCLDARRLLRAYTLRRSAGAIQHTWRRLQFRRRQVHLRPVATLLTRVGRGYMCRLDRSVLPHPPLVKLTGTAAPPLVCRVASPVLSGTAAAPMVVQMHIIPLRRHCGTPPQLFRDPPIELIGAEGVCAPMYPPPPAALVGTPAPLLAVAAAPPPPPPVLTAAQAPALARPAARGVSAAAQTDVPSCGDLVAAHAELVCPLLQAPPRTDIADVAVQCAAPKPSLHRHMARPIPPLLPCCVSTTCTAVQTDPPARPALHPRTAPALRRRRAPPPARAALIASEAALIVLPAEVRLVRVRGARLALPGPPVKVHSGVQAAAPPPLEAYTASPLVVPAPQPATQSSRGTQCGDASPMLQGWVAAPMVLHVQAVSEAPPAVGNEADPHGGLNLDRAVQAAPDVNIKFTQTPRTERQAQAPVTATSMEAADARYTVAHQLVELERDEAAARLAVARAHAVEVCGAVLGRLACRVPAAGGLLTALALQEQAARVAICEGWVVGWAKAAATLCTGRRTKGGGSLRRRYQLHGLGSTAKGRKKSAATVAAAAVNTAAWDRGALSAPLAVHAPPQLLADECARRAALLDREHDLRSRVAMRHHLARHDLTQQCHRREQADDSVVAADTIDVFF